MSLLSLGLHFLLLLLSFLSMDSCYPNCQHLQDEYGSRTESLTLKLIGLIFPESFEIGLNPGKECYYIANQFLRLEYQEGDSGGAV